MRWWSVYGSGLVTVGIRSSADDQVQCIPKAVDGTSYILVETIPFYDGIEQFTFACLIEVPKTDNILKISYLSL